MITSGSSTSTLSPNVVSPVEYTTQAQVLDAVVSGKLDAQAAAAHLARISPAKPSGKLTFKVSEKGAISVYGLSARFPVTLYVGQWERLLAQAGELAEFAKSNHALLSRKA
jgi:hypothetical protein